MKRIIFYIAFAFFTGFPATNVLPVMAGGCSSHMNKKVEIKCAEDDTECQTEKYDKLEIKEMVRS